MRVENGKVFLEPDEYKNLPETLSKYNKEQFEANNPNPDGSFGISLYELNKQIVCTLPEYGEAQYEEAQQAIAEWLSQNPDPYYMLLSNEINYYTVFHLKSPEFYIGTEPDWNKVAAEIISIIKEFERPVYVVEVDNNGVISVWVKWFEEEEKYATCFYLFPYGRGVVEI